MSNDKKPRVFKIKRFEIGLNVLVQLLLVAALVVMANYLAFRHYRRWDFSRDQKYALSGQTRNLLKSLKRPVSLTVFFSPGADIYRDVDSLLKEYQYASKGKLKLEFVDPFRNFTRARELQARYKFGSNENIVIVDYDGRHKFVNGYDMADYDTSGEMFGMPPRLQAFKGEQALTSALIDLIDQKPKTIAFSSGHGEAAPGEGTKIGTLLQYVARQNIMAQELNLAGKDSVPLDVRVLVIAGPRYDFTEREIKALRDYWEKQGRLIITLEPDVATPRLTAFLKEVGVSPRGDRILRTMPMGPGVVGILKDVSASFVKGSPITKDLASISALFLGWTESLGFREEKAEGGGVVIKPLIKAAEGFWGEVDYQLSDDNPIEFNKSKDYAAPLYFGVSAEKGGVADSKVKVNSSRMVVVGNAAFLRDDGLTEANVDFFLGSLNWLLDRERLIGIAPKESKMFTLNLTDRQLQTILLITMLGMPAVCGLVGFGVWWSRRR